MAQQETTEKLIVAVQVLREEYERAKARNRKLIAQSRRIATEVRNLARYGCTSELSTLQNGDDCR